MPKKKKNIFILNDFLQEKFVGRDVRFEDYDVGDEVEGRVEDVSVCRSGIAFKLCMLDTETRDGWRCDILDAMASEETPIEIID